MSGACEERVKKYLSGVREALRSLDGLGQEYSSLVDAAKRYAEDAEYYLGAGDCLTALAAVSYAEGLLDSLKYLGVVEARWRSVASDVERKVFVGGTFDILHPGHVDLLRFASSFGLVHVVVARDATVERLKGRKPLLNEAARLEVISSVRYVYKAILGDPEDPLASVGRVRPDVIVLGPDQPHEPDVLTRTVKSRFGFEPKVVRYPEKRAFGSGLRSTSDIIRVVCETRCS